MASVAAAAMKDGKERRLSDQVRLQTGHMLTFDDLAHRDGIAEKNVMHRVLERRIVTNTLLMNLPLSLMYFLFYTAGYYLHEDISNVFFLESTIRMRTDGMFMDVQTIDELWDQLEGPFLNTFFVQQDVQGSPLPKSNGNGDRWGQWGRIETFNQLQGGMLFSQTRRTLDPYGKPGYECTDHFTCDMCRSNAGFQSRGAPITFDHLCGSWNLTTTAGPTTTAPTTSARRLDLYREELDGTMAEQAKSQTDRFEFYLFPGMDKSDLAQRLRYYRARGWIDHFTDYLEIKFYLLNCELGRCRLEQAKVIFRFSQGGGIYYRRKLVPVFLEWFAGMKSMGMDAAFALVWFVTSLFRALLAWRAFLRSELMSHLLDPLNLFEFFVVISGAGVIGVIFLFNMIAKAVKLGLAPVRDLAWAIDDSHTALVDEMFSKVDAQVAYLDLTRFVGDFFALILMFRFFVNFGAQPRLRVVTNTLAVVLNDLFHFALVFLPVILAYIFSGIVMFGRNFDAFTTLKAAMGASFRIMMESEYDWAAWTEEYYWYTGIWTWTFMFMVVLLMLNMVLAIILDVYNEVRNRTGAKDAEPMWTTLYHVIMRLVYIRTWVPDRKLLKQLGTNQALQHSVITASDLTDFFPKMPSAQVEFLFGDCQKEMRAQAERDLDNRSLLQAMGTLMHNLDGCNATIRRVNGEEARDPIHVWTAPHVNKTSATAMGFGEHDTFMTMVSHSKGTKNPHIIDPDEGEEGLKPEAEGAGQAEGGPRAWVAPQPEWLEEVNGLLASQRQWLLHADWQLRKIQWQMQLGHMTSYKGMNDGREHPAL